MRLSTVALASALGIGIPIFTSAKIKTRHHRRRHRRHERMKRRRAVETSTSKATFVTLRKIPTTEESAADRFFTSHQHQLTNLASRSFETCTLDSQSRKHSGANLDLGILNACSSNNDVCILPSMIGYEIAPATHTQRFETYCGYEGGYDYTVDGLDDHSRITKGICYPKENVDENFLHGTVETLESETVDMDDDGYYGGYYGDYRTRDLFGMPRFFSGESTTKPPSKALRMFETLDLDISNNAITQDESHYLHCQQYCADFDEIPQVAEWLVDKTPSGNWPMFEELVADCIYFYQVRYVYGLPPSSREYCPFNMTIPMNCWNMTGVSNLQTAFRGQKSFNKPLDCWDTSSVTNVHGMFAKAYAFNQDINTWDMSSVEDLSSMFYFAVNFNQDLTRWDTSSATDASRMFFAANQFNSQIDTWNMSNVRDAYKMFFAAQHFNQPLDRWDTSGLTALDSTFVAAFAFNQPIGSWDVSGVTALTSTFMNANSFNQPLSSWDVSNVQDMDYTFLAALNFNQPLDNETEYWNVESATSMKQMFFRTSFNQCIGSWADRLSAHEGVDEMSTHGMFYGSNCPVEMELGTPAFDQGPWCQGASHNCTARTRAISKQSKSGKKEKKTVKKSKFSKHHVS